MKENTALSPETQAVLGAYFTHADLLDREVSHEEMLAAALRAAINQVVPPDPCGDDCCITVCEQIRSDFLAIVNELEAL